jgi:hypothetical protein
MSVLRVLRIQCLVCSTSGVKAHHQTMTEPTSADGRTFRRETERVVNEIA